MGRVPDWDEVHGWHEFVDNSWQGQYWCALCDCLRADHIPFDEWKAKRDAKQEIA